LRSSRCKTAERLREVEAMPYRKSLKIYRKSEVIFEENSSGSEMYIIHSGKVKLSTRAPGREVVLASMGPGEFFGEMALCDSEPRTAAATAEEDDTSLIAIDQDKFLYLVSQQPAFAFTIMHVLCKRLRDRWSLYSALLRKHRIDHLLPAAERQARKSRPRKEENAQGD
jgi:CRP/FNR family cyclic AMP-dependent transcriptional regulator